MNIFRQFIIQNRSPIIYKKATSHINDAIIIISQMIFNQLNTMVSYWHKNGLWHSVAILWEIYVMRHKCHVRWHNFHFKRTLITGLCRSLLWPLVLEKQNSQLCLLCYVFYPKKLVSLYGMTKKIYIAYIGYYLQILKEYEIQ